MIKRIFQFSLVGLFYHILVVYLAYSGWVWLSIHGNIPLFVYSVVWIGLTYSFPLWRMFPENAWLKLSSYYWLFSLQYLLFLVPLSTLFVMIHLLSVQIAGYVVVGMLVFLFVYGTINAYRPVIRFHSLFLEKENTSRSSMRIAVASDMHFGMLSGKKHAQQLVEKLNELQADLVLFPGDIIDDDPTIFMKKNIGDELATIQSRLGVYAVTGNHDYYSDKTKLFLQEMKRVGINMLLDETICIEDSFYMVGRKDYSIKQRLSVEELVKPLDSTLPILLMDHQPYGLDVLAQNGVDISFSGHTHRGQMAPGQLITRRVFELDWGYKQKNSLHTFVSSGYGFWGPAIRIGSQCEILCIDVTFKNA